MNFDQLVQDRKTKAESEINATLGKRMDEFMKSKWTELEYNGKALEPLPDWVKEGFKKAVLNVSPMALKILAVPLKIISVTKIEDLMMGQIAMISDTFTNAIPATFSDNFEDYIEKRIKLDELTFIYNDLFKKKESELKTAGQFLLAGYDKQTWHKLNGSKFHA